MVYIDLFYSTARTGAISTAYNVHLTPEELAGMLRNEQPSVVFYDPDCQDKVDLLQSDPQLGVRHWLPLDGSYEALLSADQAPAPSVPLDPEDIVLLMHTGGTTGLPREPCCPPGPRCSTPSASRTPTA